MEALLQKAARAGIEASYARTLLAALHGETSPQEPGPQAAPPAPTLPEPLSDREREVLRFLDTHLSAPQIAEELVVSRHTIRTHIKHIYDKLGAHSRAEAVERARELGLL
jgi:LuxR family maltose regulon positive regulatory protein